MDQSFLFDISDSRHVDGFGKKGAGLHWLAKHRLLIPDTLVLSYTVGDIVKDGNGEDVEITYTTSWTGNGGGPVAGPEG